ncbi:threonine--tRNA ligase [Candidatus Dependentiae bacterium]|nr:MAG: threonine--tRNA ligase [Candidatus Dependentiae bacterium]
MPKKHSKEDLKKLRHSAAHLLAHAVLELFPKTKLTIGPATEEGFFYDFLPEKQFKEEDLANIETKMREIAELDLPIIQKEIPKEEARKLYKGNLFKLELIEEIPEDTVGISTQGEFYDLCKGDHVKSTGQIKHFKLLNLSGSYWRADKTKPALQRISGTAFFTTEDLEEYEQLKEEAAKYDHRKLGQQLDLFSFHEEGPGFVFFHPKGKTIITLLTRYLKKLLDGAGYKDISTPIMLLDKLWHQSGHWEHYKKNMYFCEKEDKHYAIRPMNCPGAILIYKNRPHSYRELPLRLSEFGLVHRYELSGVLHGLFRLRAFTIDDAHIFCTIDQIEKEVITTIKIIHTVMNKFGFSPISVTLGTKPDKAMGSTDIWEKATHALQNALDKTGIIYEINEGDGAFYGPKIDFCVEDSMKREWQCSTIQLDFLMPERFDLTYIAPSGEKERTVMVHRAVYGSLERFMGILLEHYKGNLPFWLSPIQARILTITDTQKKYGQEIVDALKQIDIRVDMDESSDPISGKIKVAQEERIPWMLVIGKKEEANKTITIRHRDGAQETGISVEQLVKQAVEENQ